LTLLLPQVDSVTRQWIRNPSDEAAARNGYRLDEERGQFVITWIEKYLCLYEGDSAGQPLKMMPWQQDITIRLFGWVKHSEEWGREIRRFRKAGFWLPKKSGKSPILAAWGLYLLCGDGEMGQKVYSVAKDGKQAMIAHQHAIEMVRRSPELDAECKINKSTGQITHLSSSSFYKVVAGDNPKSQEGLNGSVMVDETHVVDRRLMTILKGAGISRSEPLQIEVSTAGNNPDGYGKDRFDYGQKVEQWKEGFQDEQFLYVAFAAPQELSDTALDEEPIKWGKLANPSWGYTIKESEFLQDYKTAKVSQAELAVFKMYRLNIWQRSSNPWLKMSDWEACKDVYTEDDLLGMECCGGLDLAKTMDTSALVLVFPMGDGAYRQLAYFWLPEETARKVAHLVPYQAWARTGHITLTPGNVCDYAFIRHQLNQILKKFTVRKIGFDSTYAEQLIQRLVEEDGWDLEQFVSFRQTIMEFAAPTAAYERLVVDGKLKHNGNAVLSWQAGNVRVRADPNQNIRPVKQQHGDHRTIDGMVAGIMGLGVAVKEEAQGSASPSVSWI
jgi:phage terminase large subunit-like protein